jgi:hypothetical protein
MICPTQKNSHFIARNYIKNMFTSNLLTVFLKRIYLTTFLFFLSMMVSAQVTREGVPYSLKVTSLKKAVDIPVYSVKSADTDKLLSEDKEFPSPYRYAVFEDCQIDLKEEALKTGLQDYNGNMWRYEILAEGFYSVQVFFNRFVLPPGASVYIYNSDYSTVYGAFTEKNNNADSSLMIAVFEGKKVIVEYFESNDAPFSGQLSIGSVGKGYKPFYNGEFSEDEEGYIGINCPEGEDWQNQKHGVCKITFQEDNFGYTCSGSFINNTRNDGTPYFLTAFHCINTNITAATVVAYFNYEQTNCNGPLKPETQTLSGATLKSAGYESDYSLLLFDNIPPDSYQPFFAGWDVSNQPVSSTVGIHHPNGLRKKISIDKDAPVTYDRAISWDEGEPSPKNTHWQLTFDEGKTFGGSSGSPLFDQNKRIIGQLHGGDPEDEYYGKLSHSWSNKSTGRYILSYYLDPDNTGAKTLDAYSPSGNLPDPQYHTEYTTVCKETPFQLVGFSAFEPISWQWDFEPATITYHNSTSSSSKEPFVSFDANGNYSVSLTATNSAGNKSIYTYHAIAVDTVLDFEIRSLVLKDSCLCDFDSLVLAAKGATGFKWGFKDVNESTFYFINDTTNPVVIKTLSGFSPEPGKSVDIILSGEHGTCQTDQGYSYSFTSQKNDSIENAVRIYSGQNGPFSNHCTTIQQNEPVPLFYSCTAQNSWCDEYGTGENIVEHSVWFYFIPEANDILELGSKGFDNQLAIYEANSYEDILNGNYISLGANDDYSNSNWNPLIEKFNVTEGNKYWVQVDGSARGEEGNFYLYLDKSNAISVSDITSYERLKIYPQPASEYIYVEGPLSYSNAVNLELYNSSGMKVYSSVIYPTENQKIKLDISGLEVGIYLINIIDDQQVFCTKFIKQ